MKHGTSQRAKALQASRSQTVLGLMYVPHVRDALAVFARSVTNVFTSCSSSLFGFEFFVLLFKVLHQLHCFRA